MIALFAKEAVVEQRLAEAEEVFVSSIVLSELPENDIWITALARQHQLTLVTRDEHFRAVDGLIVERW